jgi:peptidoglycan/LPS O-acetylase OafA/YrhL
MRLADILPRGANNLDLFRVIAAAMVIFGHAYALNPVEGQSDPLAEWLGFDSTGSLAVKVFFLLSGLVVTNSLLDKRQPLQFLIARFFRLWPALAVTVLLCALVLGPMLTSLPLEGYFLHPDTAKYIYRNLMFRTRLPLPGVFEGNALGAVNGSLWTIPHEIKAYLWLLGLFLLGLFRRRWLPLAMLTAILAMPLLFPEDNPEVALLMACFAIGATLARYKHRLVINGWVILALWLLFGLLRHVPFNFYLFYLALFTSILFVASQSWMLRLRPRSDLSYGIYLWGFPVQQVMAQFFGAQGILFNQLASVAICLVLAFCSWHLVEKPAMARGAALGRRIPPDPIRRLRGALTGRFLSRP